MADLECYFHVQTAEMLKTASIFAHHIPPNSPDSNPIENCFSQIKFHWGKAVHISLMEGKFDFIVKNHISQRFIDDLVDSMPKRLAAVVAAKGRNTKY